MRANKKTLLAVKKFLAEEQGYWDKDEMVSEIVAETNLLKHKEMEEHTLATDECGIEWNGEEVCVLSDFVDTFSNIFIEKMCNILDSYYWRRHRLLF